MTIPTTGTMPKVLKSMKLKAHPQWVKEKGKTRLQLPRINYEEANFQDTAVDKTGTSLNDSKHGVKKPILSQRKGK